MDGTIRRVLGRVLAWAALAAVLIPARSEVVVDVNEPHHLRLRFEKIPILFSDPSSRERIELDLNFPASGPVWRGLEFAALSDGTTGYRASVVAFPDGRIAVADFELADATVNPLASLPISGELVLAQSWAMDSGELPAAGGEGPIQYFWDVNHAMGAGFGLFGTLEAFVVPEPGVLSLSLLGAGLAWGWRRRFLGRKLAMVGKNRLPRRGERTHEEGEGRE